MLRRPIRFLSPGEKTRQMESMATKTSAEVISERNANPMKEKLCNDGNRARALISIGKRFPPCVCQDSWSIPPRLFDATIPKIA